MKNDANNKGMNLPNKLTVSRILLTPLCVVFIMLKDLEWSAAVGAFFFLLIAITDMLDGRIARKHNLITDFGKFLDPLADKFLVVGAYLAMIYRAEGAWELALVILTLLTVFREFTVSSLRLLMSNKENVVVAANIYGKIKTVTQIVFVIAFLIEPLIFKLFELFLPVPDIIYSFPPVSCAAYAVTTLFTLLSGVIYLKSYFPYISSDR